MAFPGQMPQMPKEGKPKNVIPKLIQNDQGKAWARIINGGFKVVYIVYDFSRKLAWLFCCSGFLFALPIMFEVFMEQKAIMDKIQNQMMNDPMGMPDMDAQPEVRPF